MGTDFAREAKEFVGAPQRLFPEFDPATPAAVFGAHGVALNRSLEWLDLLSRTRGLPSLLTFCDHRPVPGGILKWMKKLEAKTPEQVWSELVRAMDKTHGPWEDWHPVAQGTIAIQGLLEILQHDGWRGAATSIRREFPMRMQRQFEPAAAEEVIVDLRALATCLAVAGEKGARFRLARTSPFPTVGFSAGAGHA